LGSPGRRSAGRLVPDARCRPTMGTAGTGGQVHGRCSPADAWRREYLGGRGMFGLCVRFTCKDETSAEMYDRLVAETIEAIKVHEPRTLVYASHLVDGQPLQRI